MPEPLTSHPFYPEGVTYGELLNWHLTDWGTRPDGSTEARGRLWKINAFAKRVFPEKPYEDVKRKFAYWRDPKRAPPVDADVAARIEDELFGDSESLRPWRDDLRSAWNRYYPGKKNANIKRATESATRRGYAVPEPTTYFVGRDDERSELAFIITVTSEQRAVLYQRALIRTHAPIGACRST